MSRLKKAIDSKESHIKTLRIVIGLLTCLLIFVIYGWSKSPDHITIDIPPDLRTGSTRGINERHPFNVYAFGLYIFQQINNWPVDGSKDYKNRIHTLKCFITPNFMGQLERDYNKRKVDNELKRTRAIQEIPGRIYTPKRIYTESPESWVAFYDINVKETFMTEIVKDIFVRYPVRIVKWDVDPECNLWGLALDGYYGNPKRISIDKEGNNNEE